MAGKTSAKRRRKPAAEPAPATHRFARGYLIMLVAAGVLWGIFSAWSSVFEDTPPLVMHTTLIALIALIYVGLLFGLSWWEGRHK